MSSIIPGGGKKVKGSFEKFAEVNEAGGHSCILCGMKYNDRQGFVKHLERKHPKEHESAKGQVQISRELSEEDIKLRNDFHETCVSAALDIPMEWRKYFGFRINPDRKILDFAFIKLHPDVHIGSANRVTRSYHTPIVDRELPEDLQLSYLDFKGFGDFQQGHVLAKSFLTFNEEARRLAMLTSITAPQYGKLNSGDREKNEGHWDVLENTAIILNFKYRVRIVAGNYGSKQNGSKRKMATPTHWFMIILVEDTVTNAYKYTAYIFPNEKSDKPIAKYRVTLEDIWVQTGVKFFAVLLPDMEDADLVTEAAGLLSESSLKLKQVATLEKKLLEEKNKNHNLMKQLASANKYIRNLTTEFDKEKLQDTKALIKANEKNKELLEKIVDLQGQLLSKE